MFYLRLWIVLKNLGKGSGMGVRAKGEGRVSAYEDGREGEVNGALSLVA